MKNTLSLKKMSWHKKLFQSEESRFAIAVGLKLVFIPICTMFVIFMVLWFLIKLNGLFFFSHGLIAEQSLNEAYMDTILGGVSHFFKYFAFFIFAQFFAGVYLAKLLLRPFKEIAQYAEDQIQGSKGEYRPDAFSSLRFLTDFSEYFFSFISSSMKEKKFEKVVIPPQYTRIHKPKFEKVYFFHFFILFVTLIVISSFVISALTFGIHDQIVDLAGQYLNLKLQHVFSFISGQVDLVSNVMLGAIIMQIFLYSTLAFSIYSTVSGASFAVFSTMRSFMKGKRDARVHLLGYAYIRPYTRVFNKYLDKVTNELGEKDAA